MTTSKADVGLREFAHHLTYSARSRMNGIKALAVQREMPESTLVSLQPCGSARWYLSAELPYSGTGMTTDCRKRNVLDSLLLVELEDNDLQQDSQSVGVGNDTRDTVPTKDSSHLARLDHTRP